MKDGGPAFCGAWDMVLGEDNGKGALHKIEARSKGMSLRDYFAAHAPAEYLLMMAAKVQEEEEKENGKHEIEVATIMAAAALMYADAMLAERDK